MRQRLENASKCIWCNALAALGRKIGLMNEDVEVFNQGSDKTPAAGVTVSNPWEI
jgi:hypothetical protein